MVDEIAWRIDALDARGGLAFATWRGSDDDEAVDGADLYPRCIFVGAPGFQPEVVTNRSIALSSSRGLFQTGLYIENEEVTFPTLAALVEFVRRSYLTGAGGDGSDGGGGEGAPRPETPPDLTSPPGEFVMAEAERSMVKAFADASNRFVALIGDTPRGEAKSMTDWPPPVGADAAGSEPSQFKDGTEILAFGASTLLFELLQRLPLHGDDEALVRWNRSATNLGAMIGRLGLWPVLLSEPYLNAFDRIVDDLVNQGQRLPIFEFANKFAPPHEHRRSPALLPALCYGGAVLFFDDIVEVFSEPFGFRKLYRPSIIPVAVDPAIGLESIPAPRDLVRHCGAGDRDQDASIMNLTSAFIGSPAVAREDIRYFAVVLLAAASIADNTTAPNSHFVQPWAPANVDTEVYRRLVQDRADAGWNWLRSQLPAMAYSERVEDLILSAADLRYRPVKESERAGMVGAIAMEDGR